MAIFQFELFIISMTSYTKNKKIYSLIMILRVAYFIIIKINKS